MTRVSDRIPAVLIANRGEIALRILSTCRELGVRTIAIASGSDVRAPYAKAADRCVVLEGGTIEDTYLNQDLVITSALDAGAAAIHPGYGFLAENAKFASAVVGAGLRFIGPTSAVIALAGDKLAARKEAGDLEIPLLPASDGEVDEIEQALDFARKHGYPLLIKAIHGGGGRGLRLVQDEAGLTPALESAWREAERAFGERACFLERALVGARHLEVQLFGESDGTVLAVGDRDCTLQRRHQKLIEECPAPNISSDVRARMSAHAVRFAEAIGYRNAGTCEFLLDPDGDAIYFLEMNPRIQVEHPVTEMVFGVDLVAAQLHEAAGLVSDLGAKADSRGHAVEVRVNAEDPGNGFLPESGVIERMTVPTGPGVRVDLGVAEGDAVSTVYDSLIAKLVCWGADRESAIVTAVRAIDDFQITGVGTTLGALRYLLESDTVRKVEHHLGTAEALIASARSDEISPGIGEKGVDHEPSAASADFWISGRHFRISIPNSSSLGIGDPDQVASEFLAKPTGRSGGRADDAGLIVAPMQGTLIKCNFETGDIVTLGDTVFVLEAMKMEIDVNAPRSGTLATLPLPVGSPVERGAILGEIAIE